MEADTIMVHRDSAGAESPLSSTPPHHGIAYGERPCAQVLDTFGHLLGGRSVRDFAHPGGTYVTIISLDHLFARDTPEDVVSSLAQRLLPNKDFHLSRRDLYVPQDVADKMHEALLALHEPASEQREREHEFRALPVERGQQLRVAYFFHSLEG
jgi:hypothetical protein